MLQHALLAVHASRWHSRRQQASRRRRLYDLLDGCVLLPLHLCSTLLSFLPLPAGQPPGQGVPPLGQHVQIIANGSLQLHGQPGQLPYTCRLPHTVHPRLARVHLSWHHTRLLLLRSLARNPHQLPIQRCPVARRLARLRHGAAVAAATLPLAG